MYKISLPDFEGPFDLLLYFIKRDEINIYDIPISKITEEFLKYIRLIQLFDLELAGEFVVMAATLMYIKTQMLLPRDENLQDGESEDPRTQLVQRLIEYKQFKEAANDLGVLAEENRYIYYKKLFYDEQLISSDPNGIIYKNATFFDLLKAFKNALNKNMEKGFQHVVKLIPITLIEKKNQILERLKSKKRIGFFAFIHGENNQNIVVTFLAILELLKERQISIRQTEIFDDIIISRKQDFILN
ncbi:MAG: segregation/condensation protein A [FCB group bacterium]|jgi:segregation and condensation protein A